VWPSLKKNARKKAGIEWLQNLFNINILLLDFKDMLGLDMCPGGGKVSMKK